MELQINERLENRLNEEARIFAYSCDPKQWKSFTPIHRKDGHKEGAIKEIRRTLMFIDQLLHEENSEQLKKLRRLILDIV